MCYNYLNGISALITSLSDGTANSYLYPFLETLYLNVGQQLPDPSCLENVQGSEFVRGVMDGLPEPIVVHRN